MSVQTQTQQYVMHTYARKPVTLVKGQGAIVYDESGKQYFDFSSGIGVNSLGYSDPDWSLAIAKQSQTLQHTSNLYYTQPMAQLAEILCQRTNYAKVFFGNSGAEANEGAIKLARKYSFDRYGESAQRYKILTLKDSFHGRTVTTLSATGQDVFHQSFDPFTPGFDYVAANDLADLTNKLDDQVCAVMIEFVQGEGGIHLLDKVYVQTLFELCAAKDILVIADEVQTGIGRTGRLLANEHYQVQPDISTLAKGLGGGLPIGAVLCNEKLADVFQPGDHATTFGGNPVVCAGAQVVLDKLTPQVLESIQQKEQLIRQHLEKMPEVKKIDGIGLMLGIQLQSKTATEVIDACLEEGLIVLSAKEKIRLLPPLTINDEELKQGLAILAKVLAD